MRYKEPYTLTKRTLFSGKRVYYFRVYTPDGKRISRSTGESSKALARQYCETLRVEGRLTAAPVPLFLEYAAGWWEQNTCPYFAQKKARGKILSRTYLELNRNFLNNKILPRFGPYRLDRIRAGMIEAWVLELSKTLQAVTVNHVLQTLRIMLSEAARLELIRENPLDRVRPLHSQKLNRELLVSKEIKALLDPTGLQKNWKGHLIGFGASALAACTGMRQGEIMGLRWDCLHLEDSTPWVSIHQAWDRRHLKKTKTGDRREVPLPPFMVKVLEEISQSHKSGFVFSLTKGATPVSSHTLDRTLKEALNSIGIAPEQQKARGLTFHSFRHWFNTALRGRISDDRLRVLTGHKTEEMTDHYSHYRLEDFQEVAQITGEALGVQSA